MNSAIFTFNNFKIITIDIVVLICVLLIPSIAHVVPFPLYLIDPMRILLLACYIISRNSFNTYFIALTIPIFSFLVGGHPIFYKSLLISFELFSNVFLLTLLLNKTKLKIPVVLLISIIISKGIYYMLKFTFINFALIDGELVTSGLLIQLITVLIITIVFTLFFQRETTA